MLHLNNIVNARSDSGVIILNFKGHITFANQIAMKILNSGRANGNGNHSHSQIKLPVELSQIHTELQGRMSRSSWNGYPDSNYLKKVILIRDSHCLIRAFTIPVPQQPTSTCFLVLIEKLFVRSRIDLEPARVNYHLSSKEFDVVQLLIGGRTNKEIANELNIAECTVKEYLRTVMGKVRVNTRAGVVAQVLTLSSRDRQEAWKGPVLNTGTD